MFRNKWLIQSHLILILIRFPNPVPDVWSFAIPARRLEATCI
jgi:hypothetical protein